MHRLFLLAFLFLPLMGCAQGATAHLDWAARNGGLESVLDAGHSRHVIRAAAALARLTPNLSLSPGCSLHTSVLHNADYAAYSFPDGNIYLSSALVDHLSDDELTAVIAHELGHLLHNGIVHYPAALRGNDNHENIEFAADALGRELLIHHHVPTSALISALIKVADSSTPIYPSLSARIDHLHTLDQSSPD